MRSRLVIINAYFPRIYPLVQPLADRIPAQIWVISSGSLTYKMFPFFHIFYRYWRSVMVPALPIHGKFILSRFYEAPHYHDFISETNVIDSVGTPHKYVSDVEDRIVDLLEWNSVVEYEYTKYSGNNNQLHLTVCSLINQFGFIDPSLCFSITWTNSKVSNYRRSRYLPPYYNILRQY